ncbi:MAG: LysE family translocator [Rhodobacter sp.]|nr:LysE family translocator [Rhodobacter sp.]
MSVPFAPFLAAWTVLTLNLLTPGPNVMNTITTSMGSGWRAGIASSLAVALGIGCWCLAMSLGMAAVFRTFPWAETALTLVAAGLLISFASGYLRTAFVSRNRATALHAVGGLGWSASFLRSLSINATNPKALTTWIAILGLFPATMASTGDIALLTFVAALIGFGVHFAYATAFSTPTAARFYLRGTRVINTCVGVFFLGFAIKLVAKLF